MTDIKYPRKDDVRGLLVDMGDTTHEPRMIAHPPFDLLTDGILIDVIRLTGSKEETVGGNQGDERGVGPGNYYYGISNIGNQSANVIFHGWWEERT